MADKEVIVERNNNSSAGPIVAIVAVIVLLVLAYLAFQYFGGSTSTTNVNVAPATTVPTTGQ